MVLIDDLQHRSVRQAGYCNCSTVLRAMKHSHDFQQLYSFPVCGRCVIQLRARGEQFSTVNTVKHAVNYYSQHAAAAAAPTPAVAATAIAALPETSSRLCRALFHVTDVWNFYPRLVTRRDGYYH